MADVQASEVDVKLTSVNWEHSTFYAIDLQRMNNILIRYLSTAMVPYVEVVLGQTLNHSLHHSLVLCSVSM